MPQYFTILSYSHLSTNPNEAFMWDESDDDGFEKYILHDSSILECLKKIEAEISEEDFEITINVGNKYGGSCVIKDLNELSAAKIKYAEHV